MRWSLCKAHLFPRWDLAPLGEGLVVEGARMQVHFRRIFPDSQPPGPFWVPLEEEGAEVILITLLSCHFWKLVPNFLFLQLILVLSV